MAARTMRGNMRVPKGVYVAMLVWACYSKRGVEGFASSSTRTRSTFPFGRSAQLRSLSANSPLKVLPFRDAEVTEQLVGGVRYSMIPIPKDMITTTLFVTNLDEFVYDDDLSNLFSGMPACVVRKPDMTSLCYGFVAFRTSEDAKAALIRTRGTEWRGKLLDVQEVRRDVVVRVPERLVAYVKGVKAVRRILQDERQTAPSPALSPKKPNVKASKSWSPPKPSSSSAKQQLYRHLKPEHQAELDRALTKGFLVLDAPKHNPRLLDIHRRCCDARGVPQVMVVKGKGGQSLDRVLVDLSPLRLQAVFDDPSSFLVKWKIDTFSAASASGMELLNHYDQEACELDCALDAADAAGAGGDGNNVNDDWTCAYCVTIDKVTSYASKSISKLPPLSVGIFVGDRPQAKAMAKELAEAWQLPDPAVREQRAEERSKRQGKAPRRNRGGGNHQEFW